MARRGLVASLFFLSPVLFGIPFIAWKHHTTLPEPIADVSYDQVSEARILNVSRVLSETIGYRTVGTYEHFLADKWMLEEAHKLQQECELIARTTNRQLECEVSRQEGSGNHRFDIMNTPVYKTYRNLSNIIIRVSDGTNEGKRSAVLVNAHLDSTLPSPGAADDALAVGVMLDCIKVLIHKPGWSPKHAIIFLFNNAEESLQDGSQLYSTGHHTASSVRAVINLEAAGTTGREILFQATSQEMIEAYAHVPRPFGTILAQDIFRLNIIQSDTDFRQFQHYLNITGLDMAVIGNGYLYHTRKDVVDNFQPGVAQNMAENTLALLLHLSSDASPLPSLTQGYTAPTTVYFSFFSIFVVYSFATAKLLYFALLLSSLVMVYVRLKPNYNQLAHLLARGMQANLYGFVGAILVPNIIAFALSNVFGKGMSWFSRDWLAILLYGPPSMLGACISQLFLGDDIDEVVALSALLLLQSSLAFLVQMLEIGSAVMLSISAFALLVAYALNPLFLPSFRFHPGTQPHKGPQDVSLWTYALGQVFPLLLATLALVPTLEVFVPLMGRAGPAPADNIIATIVSFLGTLGFPLAIPFFHRYGKPALRRIGLVLSVVTTIQVAIFMMVNPFDAMHPKRFFAFRVENITSQEHSLHIASADGAPGFVDLTNDIASEFGHNNSLPQIVDNGNVNFLSLYPFSSVLTSYSIPLLTPQDYLSPWSGKFQVSVLRDNRDGDTRELTIKVDHPGLIWTVITFEAEIVQWDLDGNPPKQKQRHFIKETSFFGVDSYTFDMKVKMDNADLLVDFVGIQEKGMWPGKCKLLTEDANLRKEGVLALPLFSKLDEWLEEKKGGNVDSLSLAVTVGRTAI